MIEIILPCPVSLSPNRARTVPLSARTGHEHDDREVGRQAVLSQLSPLPTFPPGDIPLTITIYPPYARHLDALSVHYMLKAQLDGVADALVIDDWRFWPVMLDRGNPVAGGQVRLRLSTDGL